MNLVWIRGTPSILRAAKAVAGTMIEPETAHPFGDEWRVQGYASDEAIEVLRAQGASVDVVLDKARLEEQFERARAQIQDVPRDDKPAPTQQAPTRQAPPKGKGKG